MGTTSSGSSLRWSPRSRPGARTLTPMARQFPPRRRLHSPTRSPQPPALPVSQPTRARTIAHHRPTARPARVAMIPRYQRILFWILAGASLLMAAVLLHGCEQAREKLTRHQNETPLAAPVAAPSETIRLALANDADGSITLVDHARHRLLPTPKPPPAPARCSKPASSLEYSYKDSTHPIESGPAVDDVFVPARSAAAPARPCRRSSPSPSSLTSPSPSEDDTLTAEPHAPGGQLAVINLARLPSPTTTPPASSPRRSPFSRSSERSTQTSRASSRSAFWLTAARAEPTLNGHADLLRTYPATDTTNKPAGRGPANGRHHWCVRLRIWRPHRPA